MGSYRQRANLLNERFGACPAAVLRVSSTGASRVVCVLECKQSQDIAWSLGEKVYDKGIEGY